ncbi:Snrna-Activating Protein Complex Subunit 4 [Manis pentadactyla]|nr:Snrna-Activating Protein Complex Subunit 4 [Manis pentadactyla]
MVAKMAAPMEERLTQPCSSPARQCHSGQSLPRPKIAPPSERVGHSLTPLTLGCETSSPRRDSVGVRTGNGIISDFEDLLVTLWSC